MCNIDAILLLWYNWNWLLTVSYRPQLHGAPGVRAKGYSNRKARRGEPEEQPRSVYLHLVSISSRIRVFSHLAPVSLHLQEQHMLRLLHRYSLSLATSIMLWMVIRKPPSDIAKRVRMNKHW